MDHESAKARIDELKGYYAHLASYVCVNIFLVTINLMTSPSHLWFIYPLLGWGIGLAIHTLQIFATGHDWENRKMQELTGWSATQEELERLSDRTDTLISILSNVNWDKIDPDLIETKENLLNNRDHIVQMRDNGAISGETSKEDVVKEIEKLEAFVTSNKFNYYDQAARDPKS